MRIDKGGVEVAGGRGGPQDRFLGDLAEHHPLDRDLGLQRFQEMPGDRLALAVTISGEVELVGVLEQPFEFSDLLLLVDVDDVVGREVVVDVDAELAERAALHLRGHLRGGRDVPDMANGGLDVEIRPEVARDVRDLPRGLDDHELAPGHDITHPSLSAAATSRFAWFETGAPTGRYTRPALCP